MDGRAAQRPPTLRVALTFDAEHADRPTRPGIQEALVERLAEAGVRATFFVQGRWAEANPKTARLLSSGEHLIGSHSHYHARMTLFSDRGFATDLKWAERAIERIVRVQPRPWFRFPFGTGSDSQRSLQRLDDLGYRAIGWHVDSKDWHIRATGERVAEGVLAGVAASGDGAIVLFHTWPRSTAEAVPTVIAGLRERGAQFVTVDELPQDAVPPGPAAGTAPDPDAVPVAGAV